MSLKLASLLLIAQALERLDDLVAHPVAADLVPQFARHPADLVCRRAVGVEDERAALAGEAPDDDLQRVVRVADVVLALHDDGGVLPAQIDAVREHEGRPVLDLLPDPEELMLDGGVL